MTTPSISALSAYRTLLRATRVAFQGDFRTLHLARVECRKHFDEHRRTGVDTPMRIQGALEAAQMLRTNVVQGVREESVDEGSGEGATRYTLRIHDEIERGDNDTIRLKGEEKPVTLKPCSSK